MDVSLALKYAGRHAIKRNALVSRWSTELVERERIDAGLHCARQDTLIGRLLSAARRIPAYARAVARAPDKHRLAYLADAFPIVDKHSLLANPTDFFPDGRLPRHRTIVASTSGTTGTPLDVYRSFGSILREEAFHLQHWRWAGWRRGQRQAILRGDIVIPIERRQPPFWFQDTAGGQLVFSTRHLDRDSAPLFAHELRRSGATHLRAYPSAAYDLASFIEEAGITVHLDAVITGSEMLYDFQRRRIESVFSCKVFDFYSMAERVAYAAECEHGRMHVNPEYGIVEIVDEHGRSTDDEGQIVGTSLHNHVVPLIRYRTNDTARWSREPCACGRTYPLIEKISGRLADQLFDLDGRAVNCTIIGFAFDGMLNIRRAQVVQTEADRWIIRIVPTAAYTADDGQRVLDKLAAQVSARVRAQIELVAQLPSQHNGKYKWVSQEYCQPSPGISSADRAPRVAWGAC